MNTSVFKVSIMAWLFMVHGIVKCVKMGVNCLFENTVRTGILHMGFVTANLKFVTFAIFLSCTSLVVNAQTMCSDTDIFDIGNTSSMSWMPKCIYTTPRNGGECKLKQKTAEDFKEYIAISLYSELNPHNKEWHEEALKAVAMIIKTYALYRMVITGYVILHSECDQAYNQEGWNKEESTIKNQYRKMVEEIWPYILKRTNISKPFHVFRTPYRAGNESYLKIEASNNQYCGDNVKNDKGTCLSQEGAQAGAMGGKKWKEILQEVYGSPGEPLNIYMAIPLKPLFNEINGSVNNNFLEVRLLEGIDYDGKGCMGKLEKIITKPISDTVDISYATVNWWKCFGENEGNVPFVKDVPFAYIKPLNDVGIYVKDDNEAIPYGGWLEGESDHFVEKYVGLGGFQLLDNPVSNIHKLGNEDDHVWIQKFSGSTGSSAIILNTTQKKAHLVRGGFWEWYVNQNGPQQLGAPQNDEYDPAIDCGKCQNTNGLLNCDATEITIVNVFLWFDKNYIVTARQDFEKGHLLWVAEKGIFFITEQGVKIGEEPKLYNYNHRSTKKKRTKRDGQAICYAPVIVPTTPPVVEEPLPAITVQTLNKENGDIQISGTSLGTGETIIVNEVAVPGQWTSEGITLNMGALENLDEPMRIKLVNDNGDEFNICYPFVDVCPDAWYARPVFTLWKKGIISSYEGIISGYGGDWEGYFRPYEPPASRAELVAATVRAKELGNTPAPLTSSPFADIKIDDWYAPFVQYAKDTGLIQGCDTEKNLFCPNDPISRAASVKVVASAFLNDTVAQFQNGKQPPRLFLDVTKPEDWFYSYIYAAEVKKAVGGYSDGNFKPEQNLTRAEMAKMICIAKFGAEECIETGETSRPFIFAVTPELATLNEPTLFTVVGQNLSDAITFELTDCLNMTPIAGGTAKELLFQCTPSNTGGEKNGTLQYDEGYTVFSVRVMEQVVPEVTGVSPPTATLNQLTSFTVVGTNLPDDLTIEIAGCTGITATSRSPEQQEFQCTPTTEDAQEGAVTDGTGAKLKVFFVDVVAPVTETPIETPVTEPPVPEPHEITRVSPLRVPLNQPTVFTVTGINLTDNIAFWVAECENRDNGECGVETDPPGNPPEMISINPTMATFKCKPCHKTGLHDGKVKDGDLTFSFTVDFYE